MHFAFFYTTFSFIQNFERQRSDQGKNLFQFLDLGTISIVFSMLCPQSGH